MVAIGNLLFQKLLVFSHLLTSSKSIVCHRATARLFIATVSNQKLSANQMTSVHYIAMPEMVMRIAEVRDHLPNHQVLSTLNEKQYQHN
jgi:hypothetical protein